MGLINLVTNACAPTKFHCLDKDHIAYFQQQRLRRLLQQATPDKYIVTVRSFSLLCNQPKKEMELVTFKMPLSSQP